jgi:protein-disulfide isomerase
MYQLWKELDPQYPQVRFVFENFPIARIHPWAMTAPLAGRCAFQSKPDAFWKFHDAVFENQSSIAPENAYATIQG